MLRFGGYLISLLIGGKTKNIPEIFSGFHGFTGKTVTRLALYENRVSLIVDSERF